MVYFAHKNESAIAARENDSNNPEGIMRDFENFIIKKLKQTLLEAKIYFFQQISPLNPKFIDLTHLILILIALTPNLFPQKNADISSESSKCPEVELHHVLEPINGSKMESML